MKGRGLAAALGLLALLAAAWMGGDYDLSVFANRESLARAYRSVRLFVQALGTPDLSAEYLARAYDLSLTTLAIAILGTALAVLGGLLLGLAASRQVMVADARGASRGVRLFVCGAARLAQDTLRGVPDFAWAVLAIPILGLGPTAGIAALFLNASGILGRLYSEVFDAVTPRVLEPLRASGAGRLQTFLYGVLPAARPAAVSFSLLRWECNVRNSAVIGVVGGGGLGSELFVRLSYGEYEKVQTLLLCLIVLTLGSDLVSQVVRSRLRQDPDHPAARKGTLSLSGQRRRLTGLVAVLALLLAWAVLHLSPNLSGALTGARWTALLRSFGGLLHPQLSLLPKAVASAAVPLSMAFLGTLLATAAAAVLAYPASSTFQLLRVSFTGERLTPFSARARVAVLLLARGLATLSRAIPEVFWAMLLVSFFRLGTLPGMLALAIHSLGLLARVFAESLDAIPLRLLEVVQAASGSSLKTYLFGALPAVMPEWLAYVFFQFESNVRAAVVLGIVGVGGLGFLFNFEFEFFRFQRAGAYLLVMVALAVGLDRLSRALGLARTRVPE